MSLCIFSRLYYFQFIISRLPASNLDELRSKLRFPLIQAQGVQLEPTIIQRFIEAFTQVVDENQPVNLPASYVSCLYFMCTTMNKILLNY